MCFVDWGVFLLTKSKLKRKDCMTNHSFIDTRHEVLSDFALNKKDESAICASLYAMQDRMREDSEKSAQITDFKISGAHDPEDLKSCFVITTYSTITEGEVK